ncbi:CGNR zinc finger domain-containing protein [Kribbella sp. CA-247076]|uniref:CGNR zinc finger domain-containing protein n=1 Tax=Kribbella sp. CA-247076 TaxID=3239941 RepID=UPI003D93ACEA
MQQTADFIAGAWCLDFANTVEPRYEPAPASDYVPDYRALVGWSVKAGVISSHSARALRQSAGGRAAAAHDRAIRLREATYSVFHAVATGTTPPADDLSALRDSYADAVAQAHPRWDGTLHWSWDADDPDRIHHLLAEDAVRLLASPHVDRVKVCRPTCGWLFLDLTRNASRRWCATDTCGIREKIRRQSLRRAAQRDRR